MKHFRDMLEAVLFYMIWIIVTILPDFFLRFFISILSSLASLFFKKYNRVAMRNLELAFGDKMSIKDKRKIIKRCYKNLGYIAVNLVKNSKISKDDFLKKIVIENEDVIVKTVKEGRNFLFLSAHFGNWELLGLTFAIKYTPITSVSRDLKNTLINSFLQKARNRFGVKVINKRGALISLIKDIKSNRPIGILADQSVSEKEGILVDFFGQKTKMYSILSILSRKFNIDIFPVFVRTYDYKRYIIKVCNPIRSKVTENSTKDILECTQLQANILQKAIEDKPDEWLWFHKRWKDAISYEK